MNQLRPIKLLPADITLVPISRPDFTVVRQLAATIWRKHYVGIVSAAQIDCMLAARLCDDALWEHVGAADRWLELLCLSGAPVGYCSYELGWIDPDEGRRAAMKVGQLYLLESQRGLGLGRFMLRHIEERARELGRQTLWLQVNKRNTGAARFYEAAEFKVVREATFDIGGGFVMDDYVMAKPV